MRLFIRVFHLLAFNIRSRPYCGATWTSSLIWTNIVSFSSWPTTSWIHLSRRGGSLRVAFSEALNTMEEPPKLALIVMKLCVYISSPGGNEWLCFTARVWVSAFSYQWNLISCSSPLLFSFQRGVPPTVSKLAIASICHHLDDIIIGKMYLCCPFLSAGQMSFFAPAQ